MTPPIASATHEVADAAGYTNFILENTRHESAPLVPEFTLRLASEVVPLWQLTEEQLSEQALPPPFWAFAWAGGQALARYLLDHPECVAGKRVLDFGAGSGIVALAAARAGAAGVTAVDVDPYAAAAIKVNAQENGAAVDVLCEDIVGRSGDWQVILAGDICYEQPLADRIEAWLRSLAGRGATVLIGDPGRTYFPKQGREKIISYAVKTTRELEDTDVRNTSVWRLLPITAS